MTSPTEWPLPWHRTTMLTARQAEILLFIRELISTKGYAPTLREIGARCGIRSTNGVNDHLRALERKGYITRTPPLPRSIVLTAAGKLDPLPVGAAFNMAGPVPGLNGKGCT